MKAEVIYNWLDRQIIANEIQNEVPNEDDPYYICNASRESDKKVHIYGIVNLSMELGVALNREPHFNTTDCLYFMYKDYKIFGLVPREVQDAGK